MNIANRNVPSFFKVFCINSLRITRMGWCVAIFLICFGQCYAGVSNTILEALCSKTFISAAIHPKKIPGEVGVRYILTTQGIKIDNGEILKTVKAKSYSKTEDGSLRIFIHVMCIFANKKTREKVISNTGDSISCEEGEGLEVYFSEPNDPNPQKYHYVGELTRITNERIDILEAQAKKIAEAVVELVTSEKENLSDQSDDGEHVPNTPSATEVDPVNPTINDTVRTEQYTPVPELRFRHVMFGQSQ